MIKEHLLEDRAKEMGVTATDEEIEAAVSRVKEQYNLTTDADFEAALATSGMTKADLQRQMRQTITLQKVIGREVTSRLDLSDDALRAEYERRKETLYAIPESAHVAELVLKFSPNSPEERQQAAARIEEIRGELKAGKTFAELVKEYSAGQHPRSGWRSGHRDQGRAGRGPGRRDLRRPSPSIPRPCSWRIRSTGST